jgi:SAM-dependent methyltransferase
MRDNFSAQISPFDLVLNLFTSFAYFENPQEEEKVLANLLEATKEDGLLVIDFFNTQTVLENLTPHEQKTEDGVIFDISREAKDGFIFKHVRVKDGDKIMQYSERVRALRLSDFYGYSENLAKKNAFFWQIENVFGDYEFNNYNEAASKRMILLMRKKKSNEQFEG